MRKRIAFVKRTANSFEDEKNVSDLWLGAALSSTEHSQHPRYICSGHVPGTPENDQNHYLNVVCFPDSDTAL